MAIELDRNYTHVDEMLATDMEVIQLLFEVMGFSRIWRAMYFALINSGTQRAMSNAAQLERMAPRMGSDMPYGVWSPAVIERLGKIVLRTQLVQPAETPPIIDPTIWDGVTATRSTEMPSAQSRTSISDMMRQEQARIEERNMRQLREAMRQPATAENPFRLRTQAGQIRRDVNE